MVKVVSWNIGKREKPWRDLVQMASEGDADLALLPGGGKPARRRGGPDRIRGRGVLEPAIVRPLAASS